MAPIINVVITETPNKKIRDKTKQNKILEDEGKKQGTRHIELEVCISLKC